VALVTGGSSGLGAAAASVLLERGARVVVADLNRDAFERDPRFLPFVQAGQGGGDKSSPSRTSDRDGPAVVFCSTDVTDPGQVGAALDAAESLFGEPVNAAVCCAGIAAAQKTMGKKGPHSLDDFRRVVQVNLIGSFNVARLSAERMIRGAHRTRSSDNNDDDEMIGCIVLTASIAAYEGQIGQVAYAASKAGVVGMTLPMARDLAPHRIRVVTIVRFLSSFRCFW
jgi:NAD(P)-dependent dehydrogenase (short-subunit alcohol dehydrogenase family)